MAYACSPTQTHASMDGHITRTHPPTRAFILPARRSAGPAQRGQTTPPSAAAAAAALGSMEKFIEHAEHV